MSNRIVPADLWKRIDFREASPFTRELYLFILTSLADDEGRFYATLSELVRALPANTKASERQVLESLRYLERAELIKLYGPSKCYGYITDWLLTQQIYNPNKSFIAPPSRRIQLIHSWEDLVILRRLWTEYLRRDSRVRNDILVRFFSKKGSEAYKMASEALIRGKMPHNVADDVEHSVEHNVPHNEPHNVLYNNNLFFNNNKLNNNKLNKNKNKNNNNNKNNKSQNEINDIDESVDYMEACNEPLVGEVVNYLRPVMPPQKAQAYALQILRMLRLPNAGITEREVIDAIQAGNGPRAGAECSPLYGAEKYIQRLIAERRVAGRNQSSDFDWDNIERQYRRLTNATDKPSSDGDSEANDGESYRD